MTSRLPDTRHWYRGLSWNYNQTIMSSNVNQLTTKPNWWGVYMQRISFSLSPTTNTITLISNQHQNISLVPQNHTLQNISPKHKTPTNSPHFPMATAGKTTNLLPGAPEFRSRGGRHCPAMARRDQRRSGYRGSTVGDCLKHQIIHLDPFRRKWMVMFMCAKSSVFGGLSAHLVKIYRLNHPFSCRIW